MKGIDLNIKKEVVCFSLEKMKLEGGKDQ